MACKESNLSDSMARSSREATDLMTRYAKMNADMAESAVRMISPMTNAWMNAWMSAYQSAMPPQMKDAYRSFTSAMGQYARRYVCDIPETECPPRCACTVSWQASEGERRRAKIHIRNSSKDTITYELLATPFESCGNRIDISPAVTPASLTAAPGQTVTATVEVNVGELFQTGKTYHSEVLVRGKYERCVKVELEIACATDDVCCFDHGDIPYRTREDAWYHHFQCSEPCFEPITTRPTPGGTNPNPPGGPGPAQPVPGD